MAKGLGAIMAEIEIARKKRSLENLEAPACPLCGEPMENDGSGWFCYATERNQCPRIKEAQERSGKYRDEFQGMTLAAIVDENEPRLLAELKTVRGPYAKTNLRIWPGDGVEDAEIPALAKKHGWVFMEWMGDGWAAL